MPPSRSLIALLCTTVVLSACAEPTGPAAGDPTSARSREPTEAELDAMPPEFRFPTVIYRHDLSASFQPGYALAQSILGYFATTARLTLKMTLFRGDTQVGPERVGIEERSDFLPRHREFSAMITAGVTADCGYRFDMSSHAYVHNQFITGPGTTAVWSVNQGTQTHSAAQPACPCSTSGGYTGENGEMATSLVPTTARFECSDGTAGTSSGGNGSTGSTGGSWATVTTTTCHGTHYYDSDGNYVHSQISYCEQNTSYVWIAAA